MISITFKDTKIWQCGEFYTSHQGKYPVIFMTFKDVKFDSWQATYDKMKDLLQEEFGRHAKVLEGDQLASSLDLQARKSMKCFVITA